ncbi:MAG: hypothetical protein WC554_13375 [Clostridia bacterium]
MALQQKYNNENIFIRSIIAGLLNVLNNGITFEQAWSNDDIETINVPWYYNQSGDERFMQDFFTHYGDCVPPRQVDGNFDMIPRGVITYTGAQIGAQRITSRYVQGTYLKEVNGQLQTYRSFLYSIPLDITIPCEMWIDNFTNALKIEQGIREAFYKTKTFYTYFRGMRVGSTVGFPEDIPLEKNIAYSFDPENKIKLTFTLEIETYQPVFDPTTEVNANANMKGIGYRLYQGLEKRDGSIWFTSPDASTLLLKGTSNYVSWNYKDEGDMINKVDLYYSNVGETEWTKIEKGVPNHQYYIWNIPESFTTFKQPKVTWVDSSTVQVQRAPVIKIIPSTDSPYAITSNSFYIIDQGYFTTSTLDSSIRLIIEMRDVATNRPVFTGDASINLIITSYKLDSSTGKIEIPVPIYYPGAVAYKSINLHVANSVNNDVFATLNNIKIV